jgi:hypothetical protein
LFPKRWNNLIGYFNSLPVAVYDPARRLFVLW